MASKKISFSCVETFDIVALRNAFEKGRLFIQEPSVAPDYLREEGRNEILHYVQKIDDCTSSIYRTRIREIWHDIVYDEQLGELFFFSRYANKRNLVNWYRVTAVVCLLREWDVYHSEFSCTDLHCMLEGVSKRNNRYTGMNRYLLDSSFFRLIRKKLQKVQE